MNEDTPKPHPEPAPAPAGDSHRAAHVGKSDRHAVKAEEIERLKQEAKQAHERYLRTLAEFENTKKRLHREKEEFVRYASETVVRELLPIVDSLGQALVAVDQQADPQAIVKGVHLIYRQLLGLLEKEGVKRIPSVGETFDPHRHEAVAQVESTDGTPDERVVEEVQAGYTMHGRVIRPAIVKVAKTSQTSDTRQQTSGPNPLPPDV
ncbi:MAG: nucleotide exchange factor GrpE [Candidatus Omnitrophica bacterium]|nr:nucleotide exchange factor GrpE [Candidatus Omnitrophota bacterium]